MSLTNTNNKKYTPASSSHLTSCYFLVFLFVILFHRHIYLFLLKHPSYAHPKLVHLHAQLASTASRLPRTHQSLVNSPTGWHRDQHHIHLPTDITKYPPNSLFSPTTHLSLINQSIIMSVDLEPSELGFKRMRIPPPSPNGNVATHLTNTC